MSAETQLSKRIRQALERAGFWVMRINSGTMRSSQGFVQLAPKGTPDLHIIDIGAWVEVKDDEPLNTDQSDWISRAQVRGVPVLVGRDPAQVVTWAMGLRRKRQVVL